MSGSLTHYEAQISTLGSCVSFLMSTGQVMTMVPESPQRHTHGICTAVYSASASTYTACGPVQRWHAPSAPPSWQAAITTSQVHGRELTAPMNKKWLIGDSGRGYDCAVWCSTAEQSLVDAAQRWFAGKPARIPPRTVGIRSEHWCWVLLPGVPVSLRGYDLAADTLRASVRWHCLAWLAADPAQYVAYALHPKHARIVCVQRAGKGADAPAYVAEWASALLQKSHVSSLLPRVVLLADQHMAPKPALVLAPADHDVYGKACPPALHAWAQGHTVLSPHVPSARKYLTMVRKASLPAYAQAAPRALPMVSDDAILRAARTAGCVPLPQVQPLPTQYSQAGCALLDVPTYAGWRARAKATKQVRARADPEWHPRARSEAAARAQQSQAHADELHAAAKSAQVVSTAVLLNGARLCHNREFWHCHTGHAVAAPPGMSGLILAGGSS